LNELETKEQKSSTNSKVYVKGKKVEFDLVSSVYRALVHSTRSHRKTFGFIFAKHDASQKTLTVELTT